MEYLTEDNVIVEDFDPSPLVEDQRAALDTLYELQGGLLATNFTGRRPVAMTYYHGVESPKFVMTGFDLWTWSARDITGLVDFVLHDIWGMNRQAPGADARNAAAAPAPAPQPGAARPSTTRLPVAGGRSRQ
jgi:hypothetical protein